MGFWEFSRETTARHPQKSILSISRTQKIIYISGSEILKLSLGEKVVCWTLVIESNMAIGQEADIRRDFSDAGGFGQVFRREGRKNVLYRLAYDVIGSADTGNLMGHRDRMIKSDYRIRQRR